MAVIKTKNATTEAKMMTIGSQTSEVVGGIEVVALMSSSWRSKSSVTYRGSLGQGSGVNMLDQQVIQSQSASARDFLSFMYGSYPSMHSMIPLPQIVCQVCIDRFQETMKVVRR